MSTNTYPQVAFLEQGSRPSETMSGFTGAASSPTTIQSIPALRPGCLYGANGQQRTITNLCMVLTSPGVLPRLALYFPCTLVRVAAIHLCVICQEELETVEVCENGHVYCTDCLHSLVRRTYEAENVLARINTDVVSLPKCAVCRCDHNLYVQRLFEDEEREVRNRGEYRALVARGHYNYATLGVMAHLPPPPVQQPLPRQESEDVEQVPYHLEFPLDVALRQSYFLSDLSRLTRLFVFWVPMRDALHTVMSCVPRTICALTRFFGAVRGNALMYTVERRFVAQWHEFQLPRRPDVLEVIALFEAAQSPFGIYILEIEQNNFEPTDEVRVATLYRGGYPGLGLWLFPDINGQGEFRMLHAEPCCGDVNETWTVAHCPFLQDMTMETRQNYVDLVIDIFAQSPNQANHIEPNDVLEAGMREEIGNLEWLHRIAPWCFRRMLMLRANPNYEFVDPVDYPRIAGGTGPAGVAEEWLFTPPPTRVRVHDFRDVNVMALVGAVRRRGGIEMFLQTAAGQQAFQRGQEHDAHVPVCGRCGRRGHYTNRCNADLSNVPTSTRLTTAVQHYIATRYVQPGVVPQLVNLEDDVHFVRAVPDETVVVEPVPPTVVAVLEPVVVEAPVAEIEDVQAPLSDLPDVEAHLYARTNFDLDMIQDPTLPVPLTEDELDEMLEQAIVLVMRETEEAVDQAEPEPAVMPAAEVVLIDEPTDAPPAVVLPATEVVEVAVDVPVVVPVDVLSGAVWVSPLPPPERAEPLFWVQYPGFTAQTGTYEGAKCDCALYGLKVCMHLMKALVTRKTVLYHGVPLPLYLLVFQNVYEVALPEAMYDQRWESREGTLVFTRGTDVHSVVVANPRLVFDSQGIRRVQLGEYTGLRPDHILRRIFSGLCARLMDTQTAYDSAKGALVGLACHACNFTKEAVQALMLKIFGIGWVKGILVLPMKLFGFLGITAVEGLAVSVAIAMCAKLVCTVLIVRYLLKQSGMVQLFAAAVGGLLFSGVSAMRWLWALPTAYVAVAAPEWSAQNRQPTTEEALRMVDLVPEAAQDINTLFRRAVNTRIHLSARELTGQVASLAMRLEDAPTPAMTRVTLAVTAAQHAVNIERGRRYATNVGARAGRVCRSCKGLGEGRMKYHLCGQCTTLLPENGRSPRHHEESMAFLEGQEVSGPMPLVCVVSTPMAPPETEIELRAGSSIITGFDVRDSFTVDNCRVSKRALGVGVLHPRHTPYIAPRGMTSLVFGLLARTFSKLDVAPTPGVWPAIARLERLIFPAECLATVVAMGQEEWARSQERTEELAAAYVLLQQEGMLPEDLIVGVFGKQQLAAGWKATAQRGMVRVERIQKHKPRIIYTPNDKVHARIGPHLKPFIKFLKNVLHVDYWITYCGCLKPKEMQTVLDKLVEKMELKWWLFENDFSQFETTQGNECQKVLFDAYREWWAAPETEVLEILEALVAPRFRAKCGAHKVSGKLPPMTISGIDDTSARSTASNARVTGLSILAARQRRTITNLDYSFGLLNRECVVLDIAGDDGVLGTEQIEGDSPHDFMARVEQNIRSAGFSPKLKPIQRINEIVFLAQRPYWTVDEKGENGYYMWGPTLGRRLYKHHYVLDLVGDPYVWLGEVAQMECNCYGHVPILADIAKKTLEIVGKGKTMRKSMRQKMLKIEQYTDAREKHGRRYNERTIFELSQLYDAEVDEINNLIMEIGTIRTLPWSLGGDLVDRIMAKDDH